MKKTSVNACSASICHLYYVIILLYIILPLYYWYYTYVITQCKFAHAVQS